jgi:hypothetical protein
MEGPARGTTQPARLIAAAETVNVKLSLEKRAFVRVKWARPVMQEPGI